jgi:hypothetical protein
MEGSARRKDEAVSRSISAWRDSIVASKWLSARRVLAGHLASLAAASPW